MDSVDLLTSIDREDLHFALESQPDVGEDRAELVVDEALRIIARERRDGGDSPINDAAWEAISTIAKLAVAEAMKNLA